MSEPTTGMPPITGCDEDEHKRLQLWNSGDGIVPFTTVKNGSPTPDLLEPQEIVKDFKSVEYNAERQKILCFRKEDRGDTEVVVFRLSDMPYLQLEEMPEETSE